MDAVQRIHVGPLILQFISPELPRLTDLLLDVFGEVVFRTVINHTHDHTTAFNIVHLQPGTEVFVVVFL